MPYTTLFFDLDHTLFDFDASEAAAFEHTLGLAGITEPSSYWATYLQINAALWRAIERGELGIEAVRVERFRQLVEVTDIDADPVAMADAFVYGLGAFGVLYPGAREVLAALDRTHSMAVLTNGFSEVQRARLRRLDIEQLFDAVVISEEVGVSKPAGAFFDRAMEAVGRPDRATTLMIGDSLSADIRGAAAYGLDTCWYNPHGKAYTDDDPITYHLSALSDLPQLLGALG